MKKEVITKDDGRLLTYYWFDHDTDCCASDETSTDHESRTTDDSPASS